MNEIEKNKDAGVRGNAAAGVNGGAGANRILVVGSIAYDNLMRFNGFFKDLTVPGQYSFSVMTNNREISFGGCGGNIAYCLRLLGENPVLNTAVGNDFELYKKRFIEKGIDISSIKVLEDHLTAAAFITTDKDENQITMFDSGALAVADTAAAGGGDSTKPAGTNAVGGVNTSTGDSYKDISFALISPDNCDRMIRVAKECKEREIPFLFAPAQVTPYFSAADLEWVIANCTVLVVNNYEADLFAKQLGTARTALPMMASCYIETHGADGCSIMRRGEKTICVPAVKTQNAIDPTGCGDAFIAGIAAALNRGMPIDTACKIGALISTYNLENHGTQNHTFTIEEFNRRLGENFTGIIF